jgi:ABC-type multidrug transport system ATPase subunit
MLHRSKPDPILSKEDATAVESAPRSVLMTDRGAPGWAAIFGALFSFGGSLCLIGVGLLASFFQSVVAQDGEVRMIAVLVGLGLVLLTGFLVLEVAHTRALAGYRFLREENTRRFRAYAALPAFFLLTFIHPIAGLAIPAGMAIGLGMQWLLFRWARLDAYWEFIPSEAVAVLSGRDRTGADLAAHTARHPALSDSLVLIGSGIAVVLSLGGTSYLVAEGILAHSAILPIVLTTLLVVHGALQYGQANFGHRQSFVSADPLVRAIETEDIPETGAGLTVRGLSLRDRDGTLLLSDLGFDVAPGSLTGILGESGAGKSLLMRALADPFSFAGMEVTGHLRLNGVDPWERRATTQSVPMVLIDDAPVFLPASGQDNLSCFHEGAMLARGKWLLEQLVFSPELVEKICANPDARTLPTMYQKTLALARGFLLSPALYLMDRPEDGLPDKQVSALLEQLQRERRMGRAILLTTDNRALLEACDRLITLQEGRIIDFGPADQVRQRMDTGWARFVGERRPEIESNLEAWIRSHFRRNGDENNRRKVCLVASEILALSCQTANPVTPGTLSLSFKHFEGHCLIKLRDQDTPVSSAQIQMAQKQADETENSGPVSPLTTILRNSMDVHCETEGDSRVVVVKIATYDPRKTKPTALKKHDAKSA